MIIYLPQAPPVCSYQVASSAVDLDRCIVAAVHRPFTAACCHLGLHLASFVVVELRHPFDLGGLAAGQGSLPKHSPDCFDRLASDLVADLGQHLGPIVAIRHSSLLFEIYCYLKSRAVIILINFIISPFNNLQT